MERAISRTIVCRRYGDFGRGGRGDEERARST